MRRGVDEERSYLGPRLITVGIIGFVIYLIIGFSANANAMSGPMFRLLATTWVTIVGLLVAWVLMREPSTGRPLTWAAAMAGAVGLFALMMLAYGSVPHEWLTYADSILKWRDDKLFLKHGQFIFFHIGSRGWKWPLDITGRDVRDVVATLIYIVFFGLQLAMTAKWQKNKKNAPRPRPAAAAPAGTSAFGRPVVKQSS
jgi:hypothetical protein